MHEHARVLLLTAALVSGGGLFAAQSTALNSTTLRVRGTIDKYDAASRTLVLSTSNGTVRFPVASTTRIRQGWHNVDPSELQKLAGDRATVRYTESAGNKIVESVHVFGKGMS